MCPGLDCYMPLRFGKHLFGVRATNDEELLDTRCTEQLDRVLNDLDIGNWYRACRISVSSLGFLAGYQSVLSVFSDRGIRGYVPRRSLRCLSAIFGFSD